MKYTAVFVIKDRWLTLDFMLFSTAFQSYQNDAWGILKGCVQRNPFIMEENPASSQS